MTSAYLSSFYLFLLSVILDLEKHVGLICLQLILLPLSSLAVPPSPDVNWLDIFPPLSLSIPSHLFVDLSWVDLLSCLQLVEASEVAAICWSAILHGTEWKTVIPTVHTGKRSIVKFPRIEDSQSSKRKEIGFWVFEINNR